MTRHPSTRRKCRCPNTKNKLNGFPQGASLRLAGKGSLRMFIRTIATLFAAGLLATTVEAATVEEFTAEDWQGMAFTSDQTGELTHCSVYAGYKNGSTLYISYQVGDSWYFSVSNDDWKLSEGGSYPIKFKVDGRG